jgi:parvulin-like peptidyl-prolyl isomerase
MGSKSVLGMKKDRGGTRPAPRAPYAVLMIAFILLCMAPLSGGVGAAEEKADPSSTATPETGGESRGKVVARVNGAEITEAALSARMGRMHAGMGHGEGHDETEAARREALNRLILQELAYQRAKAAGVKIEPKELDDAIAEIKTKAGGEEKYLESLEKRHMTEEGLRKDLERNLMIKHIFEKEVSSGVSISEEEVKKEYEKVKGEFSRPEKVIVDDVVLFLDLDDKNSPAVAEELLRKIGNDTEKNPWNIPPDGTFAVRELDLRKNKQEDLYRAARELAEGQLSPVIKTSDSFHIIKLKKYSPEVKADFAQIRGLIERKLRAAAQQKRMAEWEAGLRKNAKIEILDPGEAGEKKE